MTDVRSWVADLVFAAAQQTGVAATIATIYILADRIGPERAIWVGLMVGLGTALLSSTLKRAVKNGPRPDGPESKKDSP